MGNALLLPEMTECVAAATEATESPRQGGGLLCHPLRRKAFAAWQQALLCLLQTIEGMHLRSRS